MGWIGDGRFVQCFSLLIIVVYLIPCLYFRVSSSFFFSTIIRGFVNQMKNNSNLLIHSLFLITLNLIVWLYLHLQNYTLDHNPNLFASLVCLLLVQNHDSCEFMITYKARSFFCCFLIFFLSLLVDFPILVVSQLKISQPPLLKFKDI